MIQQQGKMYVKFTAEQSPTSTEWPTQCNFKREIP